MDSFNGTKAPDSISTLNSTKATLPEWRETDGYTVNVDVEHRGELKTAKDGHTVLIPQPSDDPRDPLNWSPLKKHVILVIISFAAFLPDYGSATGAVTLIAQAA